MTHVQPTLFPAPELPAETQVLLKNLPSDEDLGPLTPDGDLCRNVEHMGIINPVCLKKDGKKYRVVEGKRRIMAARKCNQKQVPARIFPKSWTDEDILQISLHENRRPNPVSELEAFEGALRKGNTVSEIKSKTGLKQGKVRVLLKLQKLIPELRTAMSDGRIKPSVAHLAAKQPKSEQRKLLKPLKDNGRIKVKDVREIQVARKKAALAELPAFLFEDDGDWKIAALAKAKELGSILETHGDGFKVMLADLEKKIQEN